MSMRDYPFDEKGAFFIDAEVAAYMMLSVARSEGEVDENIRYLIEKKEFDNLVKMDFCDPYTIERNFNFIRCVSSFDGEISTIAEAYDCDHSKNIDITLNEDTFCYVPAYKEPVLIGKPAYADLSELVNEYKKEFAEEEIVFPDDFNWEKHIVDIVGTIYG